MALTAHELSTPLGPLRRETFRDSTESDFVQRVGFLLERAQATATRKAAAATDELVEALALALAFDQAASIWAALPSEEGVAGEVSMKYLSPKELRLEAERYFERYASLLSTLGPVVTPSRTGRLRRT